MLLQNEDGGSRQTFFLGQEFVDQDTKKSVQAVIASSCIMSGFQVVGTLLMLGVRITPNKLQGAFVNLLMGLALPACGFIGATRSSTNMMCCFCGTNLVAAICQFLTMLMFVVTLCNEVDVKTDACQTDCRFMMKKNDNTSSFCSCVRGCNLGSAYFNFNPFHCCPDYTEVDCRGSMGADGMQDYLRPIGVCARGVQEGTPMGCEDFLEERGYDLMKLAIAVVLIMLLAACLSGYAFYHGSMLWKRLFDGDQLVPSRSQAVAADNDGSVAPADEEDALGVE